MQGLNPLAQRVLQALLQEHPGWAACAESVGDGDLELAVPAPRGSRAKHLVVLTSGGRDIWIRYAPPRMFHAVASEREATRIVAALLADAASFLVITRGDEWIETGLLPAGQEPVLLAGQVANVVSWSGIHDRIVTSTPRRASS
jgi:hypothetical protein